MIILQRPTYKYLTMCANLHIWNSLQILSVPDSLQYSLREAQDKVVYQEARSAKTLILWELVVEISIHLAIRWVSNS